MLDVRTPAEHAEGHIPGTHFNIDILEDNYTDTALKKLPKDKPVALCAAAGVTFGETFPFPSTEIRYDCL